MPYYKIIDIIESFDDAFSLMQYTTQRMKENNFAPGDIEDYIYDAISKDNMYLVECSKKILYKCILEEQKNHNFNNNINNTDLYTYYDDSDWYNNECYNDNYMNNNEYNLSLFDHDISSDCKCYDEDIYEGYDSVNSCVNHIPYNNDFEDEIQELYFV